jgi:hypothetical protein
LRNGALFQELPDAFKRLQQRLLRTHGGDREMVEILALVLHHDEQAVLVAVELALEDGVPTKTHILKQLHRLLDGKTAAPTVVTAPQALILTQEPIANVGRYDTLRQDGEIVERWAFSDKDAPPNLSGHTQNDGPVEAGADEDTGKNKSLIKDYYEVVHINARHDEIPKYVGEGCIRHEPGVHDGMEAFIKDVDLPRYVESSREVWTIFDYFLDRGISSSSRRPVQLRASPAHLSISTESQTTRLLNTGVFRRSYSPLANSRSR